MSARVSGFYTALISVPVLFILGYIFPMWLPTEGAEFVKVCNLSISWIVAHPLFYATKFIFQIVGNKIRTGAFAWKSTKLPSVGYFMDELASLMGTTFVLGAIAFGAYYVNNALVAYSAAWLYSALPSYIVLLVIWSIVVIAEETEYLLVHGEIQGKSLKTSYALQVATKTFFARWNPVYNSIRTMLDVLALGILLNMFASLQNMPNIPLGMNLAVYPVTFIEELRFFVDTGGMFQLGNLIIAFFPMFMRLYVVVIALQGTVNFCTWLWKRAELYKGYDIPVAQAELK